MKSLRISATISRISFSCSSTLFTGRFLYFAKSGSLTFPFSSGHFQVIRSSPRSPSTDQHPASNAACVASLERFQTALARMVTKIFLWASLSFHSTRVCAGPRIPFISPGGQLCWGAYSFNLELLECFPRVAADPCVGSRHGDRAAWVLWALVVLVSPGSLWLWLFTWHGQWCLRALRSGAWLARRRRSAPAARAAPASQDSTLGAAPAATRQPNKRQRRAPTGCVVDVCL
jgi:hypothetical protein